MAKQALLNKKGEDVIIFDVRRISAVTDFYVVASGSSPPHLKAMLNEALHLFEQAGVHCYRRSDDKESGWLVLDYIDVVIHILSSEARRYYAIEDLWANAPRLD